MGYTERTSVGEVFRIKQLAKAAFFTSDARIIRKAIDLNDPFQDLADSYRKSLHYWRLFYCLPTVKIQCTQLKPKLTSSFSTPYIDVHYEPL